MINFARKKMLHVSAAFVTGFMLSTSPAHANNFNNITQNIATSISDLPGLISGLSYLAGIAFGVMGIVKIKDHVENPQQTGIKEGAIRLAAGGGLFALPIVFEAMRETVGSGANVTAPTLNKVEFSVQ
jgi:hypothetical protein